MFAWMKIVNKKAIVILPHLMETNGVLDEQTISRINHSIKIFKEGDYDFFITSGWDYRKDSDKKILTDTYSRDTVGDAFFIREQFVIPMNILNLTVVTSDWHVNRTKKIFNKFFQKKIFIKLIGVSTSLKNNDLIVKKVNVDNGDISDGQNTIIDYFTKDQLEILDNLNKTESIGGIN